MLAAIAALLLAQAAAVPVNPANRDRAAAPAPKRPMLPSSVSGYFKGQWTGSGKFVGTGKALQSLYDFEPGLGGEDMIVAYREMKPATFAYNGLLSVDSNTGELVLMMAANLKGGARLFKSPGWIGDRLVFQSVPALKTWFGLERLSFWREAPDRFRATYELSVDNGLTWHVGDDQTFTRNIRRTAF